MNDNPPAALATAPDHLLEHSRTGHLEAWCVERNIRPTWRHIEMERAARLQGIRRNDR